MSATQQAEQTGFVKKANNTGMHKIPTAAERSTRIEDPDVFGSPTSEFICKDPDPDTKRLAYICTDPDPSINKQNNKETLIFTVVRFLYTEVPQNVSNS